MYYVRRNSKLLFLFFDLFALFIGSFLFFSFFKSEFSFSFFALLVFVSICLSLFTEEYWDISYRGLLVELKSSFLYVLKLLSIVIFFLVVFGKAQSISFSSSILLFFVVLFFCFYSARFCSKFLNKRFASDSRNVLVLSSLERVDDFVADLPDNFSVVGFVSKDSPSFFHDLPVLHDLTEVRDFISLNRVDEIFANFDASHDFFEVLSFFEVVGITTRVNISPVLPRVRNNTVVTFLGDRCFLTSAIKIASFRQLVFKRSLDIVLALIGIIITFFVALFIKPIISNQAPGPLFFKQVRVGQNGKRFEIYKFRSMYIDAEKRKSELLSQNDLDTSLMFKLKNDPRVFPFGQKLRNWSLDELPQFFNVLKGDMSVVGTRPPTVDEYLNYEIHQFKRLAVKPGITGLWQVSGRSDIKDFDEVVKLDMEYIENWSLRLDLKIILRTILVVLKREGSR